jgi:hypothetical protein
MAVALPFISSLISLTAVSIDSSVPPLQKLLTYYNNTTACHSTWPKFKIAKFTEMPDGLYSEKLKALDISELPVLLDCDALRTEERKVCIFCVNLVMG